MFKFADIGGMSTTPPGATSWPSGLEPELLGAIAETGAVVLKKRLKTQCTVMALLATSAGGVPHKAPGLPVQVSAPFCVHNQHLEVQH
jgi:hypothetical protein